MHARTCVYARVLTCMRECGLRKRARVYMRACVHICIDCQEHVSRLLLKTRARTMSRAQQSVTCAPCRAARGALRGHELLAGGTLAHEALNPRLVQLQGVRGSGTARITVDFHELFSSGVHWPQAMEAWAAAPRGNGTVARRGAGREPMQIPIGFLGKMPISALPQDVVVPGVAAALRSGELPTAALAFPHQHTT